MKMKHKTQRDENAPARRSTERLQNAYRTDKTLTERLKTLKNG